MMVKSLTPRRGSAPLRFPYQLITFFLGILMLLPGLWAIWHVSPLLAEYYGILPGLPVKEQANAWLWAAASLAVFVMGMLLGYLLLAGVLWVWLLAIGWRGQAIADMLLRSRYPAHWYQPAKAQSDDDREARSAGAWKWLFVPVVIAVPAFMIFYALPQGAALSGDEAIKLNVQEAQQSSAGLSPAQLRDQMRARYRLPPDRRFTLALGHLAKMAERDTELVLHYRDASWWVTGSLGDFPFPELPTFEAGLVPLQLAAKVILAELSVEGAGEVGVIPVYGMDPDELFRVLADLDRRWAAGERHVGLLQAASVASVRLAFVAQDRAGVDDQLPAQALALLALLREWGVAMPLEESMLAHRMGYVSHALALAEALPRTHPWYLYLHKQDEQLADAIERDGEFAYLLLDRLVRAGKTRAWQAAVQHHDDKQVITSPHLLALGLRASDMTVSGRSALLLPVQVSRSMSRNDAYLDRDRDGPFLSMTNYRAYHRVLLESGLYTLARLNLDRRSALADTGTYLTALRLFDSEIAQRHAEWLDALLASKQGKVDLDALRRGVGDPSLGTSMRRRSLDEWLRYAPAESALMTEVIGEYLQGMDSRIEHRFELAGLAKSQLLHVSLMDELYRSIRRDDERYSQRLAAFLAYYHDDTGSLFSLARDEELEPHQRLAALNWLRRQSLTQQEDDALAPIYQALIEQEPKDWSLRGSYLDYLNSRNDHQGSLLQIRQWLALRDEETSAFDIWRAAIALSRAHEQLGEMSEAWAVVVEHLESQYNPIFNRAAAIMFAMGDLERAELIARAQQRRYSSSLNAQLSMLRVLWRRGEHAAAAVMLRDWHQPISMQDWRWEVGKVFSDEVSAHGLDAHAALRALSDAGISHHNLNQLVLALGREQAALAMALADELRVSGLAQISLDIDAYALRRKVEGDAQAAAWLRQRLANMRQDAVAGIALERRQYAVPWQVAEPDRAPHPDAAWLYRATVVAMGMEDKPLHREQLAQYYAGAQGSFYEQLGMMVLGMIDEDSISRQTMGLKQISEAAYYLGIRALSEGRYHDGAEWLRVSMETGQQRNGEYRWSLSLLERWLSSNRSLAVLASSGALYCDPNRPGACVSTDE